MATSSAAHNLNALLLGTAEFSFAETPYLTSQSGMIAAARIAGFRDFGNMNAFSVSPEVTTKEHKGSYQGVLRVDSTKITDTKLSYKLTMDEFTYQNMLILMMGAEATSFTQADTWASGAAADAWAFNTTAAKIGYWYDITASGVRIRHVSAVTIATLTEGTDFDVDFDQGRVRFLTAQSAARTPTVTAPAITTTDAKAMRVMTPMQSTKRVGIGRIAVYDDYSAQPIPMEHVDFSCEVTPEGQTDFGGEDFGKFSLNVLVTAHVGTVRVREVSGGTVVA